MEPDTKMLQEILELSRENNRMLRAIRRASFWSGVFRIIWWAMIIGVPIWLYFQFFQPYMNDLQTTYQSVRGGAEKVQNIGNGLPPELKTLLEKYGVTL